MSNKGSNAIMAEVELIENKNIKSSYEKIGFKSSTAHSLGRWVQAERKDKIHNNI